MLSIIQISALVTPSFDVLFHTIEEGLVMVGGMGVKLFAEFTEEIYLFCLFDIKAQEHLFENHFGRFLVTLKSRWFG